MHFKHSWRGFLIWLFGVFTCLNVSGLHAFAQPVRTQHLTVELLTETSSIAPNRDFLAGLHFILDKGWHIYWINAGDAGEPPRVDWQLPAGITAGALQFPAPQRLPLGPLRRLRQRAWRGARGCNLAIWRSDLDRVDGFDADYCGWGPEDSDIIVRLIHAGVRRKDGRFATGVLHLWHAPADRSRLPQNARKLSDTIAGDDVRARRGMSAIQTAATAALAG